MKTIILTCEICKKEFTRLLKEYKRNSKKNRRIFCGLGCKAIAENKRRMTPNYCREHCYDLSQHAGNRLSELSPFKIFLNKGRASIKKHEVKITPEYLKKIWENQGGICPYTGIKMLLPQSSSKYHTIKHMTKASLDRIDSSIGYVEGNVEFVCWAINAAKNSFTKNQMKEFLQLIDLRITHP